MHEEKKEETFDEFMSQVDMDRDGKIQYSEFQQVMQSAITLQTQAVLLK